MPEYRNARAFQCLFLLRLEPRTDLDQVRHDCSPEFRHDLYRPQRIFHHGAAARAELDQPHVLGLAHLLPHRGRPQADQFSEHLAHFRRSDEIAARAERVACGVVAERRVKKAERHIFGDRHRTRQRNAPANFNLQRRTLLH